MGKKYILSSLLFTLFFLIAAYSQDKPNIVIIFPDNLGFGEINSFGGARNVPTPNIDRLADEGIRFTNFNVEYSCSVSRIALLTGRYAVRTGDGYASGMTLWEETIAELLRSNGYATALFGKWHVGGFDWKDKREPIHQGFEEWWGIPGTTHTSQFTSFENFDINREEVPFIWQGSMGGTSERVKPYNIETRRTIDRESAEHGIQFMEKNVKAKKPFFLFLPMSHVHFPTLTHLDFAGSTGAGDVGDAIAEVDYNTGLILNALKRLGIEDNTLVIWGSDNGAEMRRPWRGSSGPWRGFYNTAMEGGIRTPFIIKWPAMIPSGRVSNELMHEVDQFPTIAAAIGIPELIPNDRHLDGVDQLPFLANETNSKRNSALFIAREGHVMAVKWMDWKLWYHYTTEMPDPDPNNLVRLFDLRVDPREENDVKDFYPWVISVMDSIVHDYEKSLLVYPRVPNGVKDPFTPPPPGSGSPISTFHRTDQNDLDSRSEALPDPDFSGTWSTSKVSSAAPTGRAAALPTATLGSGWGNKISIVHKKDEVEIERVFFTPREIQPLIKYRFAIDGKVTENPINMGRTEPAPTSKCSWDGNRFIITTTYSFKDPESGNWFKSEVTQTLWLQPATGTPFEPVLVVETTRGPALNGKASTTRTYYNRGYR